MKAPNRTKPGRLEAGRANARETAVLAQFGKNIQWCTYDFSADGGAVGLIQFTGAVLPAGSIVTNVWSDEVTAVTSGGAATIQLKAGATDLTGDEAFTAYVGTESRALASSATAIKLAAASQLNMSIETAAVTAGKVRFAVEYIVGKDY